MAPATIATAETIERSTRKKIIIPLILFFDGHPSWQLPLLVDLKTHDSEFKSKQQRESALQASQLSVLWQAKGTM